MTDRSGENQAKYDNIFYFNIILFCYVTVSPIPYDSYVQMLNQEIHWNQISVAKCHKHCIDVTWKRSEWDKDRLFHFSISNSNVRFYEKRIEKRKA